MVQKKERNRCPPSNKGEWHKAEFTMQKSKTKLSYHLATNAVSYILPFLNLVASLDQLITRQIIKKKRKKQKINHLSAMWGQLYRYILPSCSIKRHFHLSINIFVLSLFSKNKNSFFPRGTKKVKAKKIKHPIHKKPK